MSKSFDFLVRVRYAETDKMGVVYYGNYYIYFEIGRVGIHAQSGHRLQTTWKSRTTA